ncbi:MAG: carboxypeptidase-like regulatory domain-containing protein [Flavobacteriales bacterium]|nr:carboxypeptidase-like regulatory domain-containing protein [Flavobacteriales bacterium]
MRSVLIIYLFCFLGAFTQENKEEKLFGHVFEIENDSLSPLPGVHVYYLGTTKGAITDEKGVFNLDYDHSNNVLVFSFIGYQPDTLTIELDQEINVVMGEGKILKDFEVEFKKGAYSFSKIDPRHAHIIGQDELRKAACCNLAESFETNPSIDATFTDAVTGTKQIQMMGLSGKYVQMLSGNMPAIRGLSTLNGLKQIPGAFIHQLAVSKGAGSVLNGYESMVGQINMNLKQPENAEKFHFNFYLNQGGRTEYNTVFSKEFGKRWATTFLAHFEDQTKENDRNNDGFLDNPLLNNYIIYNQWNFRSRFIHMELGGSAVLSTMNSGKINLHHQTEYPVNIETGQANIFSKIGYLFPDNDFKSLALQLSATYNQQNTTIGQTIYNGNQMSGYANLIYQQELGKNPEENYFKIGASCQIDSVNENLNLSYFYDSTSNAINFNWLEVVPGVFSEFTHNTEKWGIIAGLRGDYTTFYDKFFLTPRLHLRYSLNSETAIKLMAGSGRKTPFMLMENIGYMATSRKWNFLPINLQNLGQEYSFNLGLALLKEFTLFNRDGTLTLDAYHTFFENQLVVDLDQSARQVDFYALEGVSYSNSIQAEINYKINRRWEFRTAYRFLDVKKDYQSGLKEKPLLSKHRGFLNISYSSRERKDRQWKADITTQWIGSQRIPFTQDNEVAFQLPERSEDYIMLSGQITRIFSKRVEAYLGVENALNYRQTNPILSSENPYDDNFDSSLIWAPIFGRMVYAGFRFTIGQKEN